MDYIIWCEVELGIRFYFFSYAYIINSFIEKAILCPVQCLSSFTLSFSKYLVKFPL